MQLLEARGQGVAVVRGGRSGALGVVPGGDRGHHPVLGGLGHRDLRQRLGDGALTGPHHRTVDGELSRGGVEGGIDTDGAGLGIDPVQDHTPAVRELLTDLLHPRGGEVRTRRPVQGLGEGVGERVRVAPRVLGGELILGLGQLLRQPATEILAPSSVFGLDDQLIQLLAVVFCLVDRGDGAQEGQPLPAPARGDPHRRAGPALDDGHGAGVGVGVGVGHGGFLLVGGGFVPARAGIGGGGQIGAGVAAAGGGAGLVLAGRLLDRGQLGG
ncbi:hypothetical protein CJ469_06220 [Nocardia farcinica]|nr:hypothetical protein CJ469_06220 [Nocardia farcinica]